MARSARDAAIAMNRFGLGARPGELAAVSADPRGWLEAQLTAEARLPPALRELPSTGSDQWAFWSWLLDVGREVRRARRFGGDADPGADPAQAFARGERGGARGWVEASFERTFLPRHRAALAARLRVAVETSHPLRERLVHFWSNHFVVSSARPVAVAMPPSFERDVVRPNVTGRFVDMLLASTRHPAMLTYLDNATSIGPGSTLARKGPRKSRVLSLDLPRGLNENLAREILELQTIGVDGGYDQQDVTAFARVLTGWGVRQRPLFGRWLSADRFFRFDASAHEPGRQHVLGRGYDEPGVEQGESVLHDLARQPATARFVASKLVRHFVADQPPPAAVDRVAAAFLESEGDLVAVTRAVIHSPEAWATPLAKLKRPEELVVSTHRALGLDPVDDALRHDALDAMGQRPYWAPTPAGWGDLADDWAGSDAVWKRVSWSAAVGARAADGVTPPIEIARAVLGPVLTAGTVREIAAAASAADGFALLIASPEFQRR